MLSLIARFFLCLLVLLSGCGCLTPTGDGKEDGAKFGSLSNVGVWFSKINFPSSKISRFLMELVETKHNSVSQIVEVTIAVSNTF